MVAAQRIAVQLPRARHSRRQNSSDLAREAVGCNGVLAAGYNGIVLDRRILVIRRAAKAAHIAS